VEIGFHDLKGGVRRGTARNPADVVGKSREEGAWDPTDSGLVEVVWGNIMNPAVMQIPAPRAAVVGSVRVVGGHRGLERP